MEELVMSHRPGESNPVEIFTCDEHDGAIHITFGAGVTIGEVVEALSGLPPDAEFMAADASYYCSPDCEGQPVPGHDHDYFVITLTADTDE